MSWDPLDIENLHKEAQFHMFCPYYAVKDRASAADVIFMPYNYLIDEKIRENYQIAWDNSIIIFDEAHNVTQATEDVTSFELKAESLQNCVREIIDLQAVMSQNDQKEWKTSDHALEKIKEFTSRFFAYLTNFSLDPMENSNTIQIKESKFLPPQSLVLSGNQVFSIFFEGVTFDDIATDGKIVKCDLRSDWLTIQGTFE